MSSDNTLLEWHRVADTTDVPPGRVKTVTAGTHSMALTISGDGGFGQYMGDFNTAVKYNMDITHVLLNNSQLGKISKEQLAGEWPVWQTDLHNPNFASYAKLCGGKGIRVTKADQLESAIHDLLNHAGPALVEVITDADLI